MLPAGNKKTVSDLPLSTPLIVYIAISLLLAFAFLLPGGLGLARKVSIHPLVAKVLVGSGSLMTVIFLGCLYMGIRQKRNYLPISMSKDSGGLTFIRTPEEVDNFLSSCPSLGVIESPNMLSIGERGMVPIYRSSEEAGEGDECYIVRSGNGSLTLHHREGVSSQLTQERGTRVNFDTIQALFFEQ